MSVQLSEKNDEVKAEATTEAKAEVNEVKVVVKQELKEPEILSESEKKIFELVMDKIKSSKYETYISLFIVGLKI